MCQTNKTNKKIIIRKFVYFYFDFMINYFIKHLSPGYRVFEHVQRV